jgi:hypothetical protein
MCQDPRELANYDEKFADPGELHVHINGRGNGIDHTDQHNLEECLIMDREKRREIKKNNKLHLFSFI